MIFEVAIGDRIRTVGVVRKGALLHVELDGRTHIVDARRVNGDVISMLVQLADASSPSRSIDAAFSARPGADDLDVYLDGRTVAVQIRPAGAFGRQKKPGAAAGAVGPQRVVAPMPGRVVSVLVEPGDDVVERQAVVVLEAMKMQNEVRAARSGVVAEVRVASGAAVEAGAVLVVIGEPRASGGS